MPAEICLGRGATILAEGKPLQLQIIQKRRLNLQHHAE
jgi:hypothetical protein